MRTERFQFDVIDRRKLAKNITPESYSSWLRELLGNSQDQNHTIVTVDSILKGLENNDETYSAYIRYLIDSVSESSADWSHEDYAKTQYIEFYKNLANVHPKIQDSLHGGIPGLTLPSAHALFGYIEIKQAQEWLENLPKENLYQDELPTLEECWIQALRLTLEQSVRQELPIIVTNRSYLNQ